MSDKEKLENAIRVLEGNYKSCVFRHKEELVPVTDIIALLKALYRDVDAVRSCQTCVNRPKCDANDDGWKQRFWVSCGGSVKIKWEWQGITEAEE